MTLKSLMRTLMRSDMLLRIASVTALISIALMVWSLIDPTVASVMIAMMIGQGIGMLSFLAYLLVMARDLRHALRNPTHAEDPPALEE